MVQSGILVEVNLIMKKNRLLTIIIISFFVLLNIINIIYSRSLVNNTLIHLQNSKIKVEQINQTLKRIETYSNILEKKINDTDFSVVSQFDDSLRDLKGHPVTVPKKITEIDTKLLHLIDTLNLLNKRLNELENNRQKDV